jgi:hypothetical protein
MRFHTLSVVAFLTMANLSVAQAVEAPEAPVSPVPDAPNSAAPTPYPQVTTPAVLTSERGADSQPALPPIKVPTPPSRENGGGLEDNMQAVKSKSPGG